MPFNSFTQTAGGGGTPAVNLSTTYEPLGFSGASITTLTTTTSASKGDWITLGTTTANWAGFWLQLGRTSSASAGLLIDMTLNDGSTLIVSNYYVKPMTNQQGSFVWFPLAISSGMTIKMRAQASQNGVGISVALLGEKRTSASLPMFTSITALNADTTTVTPSSTEVACNNTYVTMHTTSMSYSGLMVSLGHGSSNPSQSEDIVVTLATGSPGSEVEIAKFYSYKYTINPILTKNNFPPLFVSISNGTVIRVKIQTTTATTDTIRVGIIGIN